MQAQDIDNLIAQIRGLVRSIPRDVGMYASLNDGYEPSGEVVISVYLDEAKGPRVLMASTRPHNGELDITGLCDALLEWITERRKAA